MDDGGDGCGAPAALHDQVEHAHLLRPSHMPHPAYDVHVHLVTAAWTQRRVVWRLEKQITVQGVHRLR